MVFSLGPLNQLEHGFKISFPSRFRVSRIFVDHLVIPGQDVLLVPNYVTYKTLQGSYISPFDVQRRWFDRFSFKLTKVKVVSHILEEVFSRLASRKAIRKFVMKSSQFIR